MCPADGVGGHDGVDDGFETADGGRMFLMAALMVFMGALMFLMAAPLC